MERRNAWLSYKEAEETEMEKLAKAYREFLDKGKTERECVAEIVKEAEAAGYESLESKLEKGEKIKAGDKVYAVGMKKIVALFHVGCEELSRGMSILCAHIDSPRLDVKQNPLYEDTDLAYLDTHYYGGVKKYQWVTLPLAMHGVVAKKDGSIVEISIGEDAEDPVLYITDLLIHLSGKQLQKKAAEVIEGEMLDILIEENTDLNVEITQGVGGGTSNIQPAMEQGEFDIYPEYTGTAWNMVLKNDDLYTEERFDELQDAYAQDYDMEWIGMYGFNNSYALAVRSEIAQQYDLKNISDLRGIADELTFGAEYDFYEREDGYSPLCETYGLTFANTVDLDIGLKYQAIAQDEIDVMPIFTTDGQVSVSDLVILNDDLHFYPSYQCGNVVRSEILERYPQLRDVLGMVEGILSDRDMAHLNYLVESENVEPRDAARQYLQENGLITEEE